MSAVVGYLRNGVSTLEGTPMPVLSPWDGHRSAEVAAPTPDEVADIVNTARAALPVTRATPRSQRAAVLELTASALEDRAEEFARVILQETGKTIRDCRAEVARAVPTLRFSADAARHLAGEQLALDAVVGIDGRLALTVPRPIGVVAAIPAFNYPLLLAAHKVGPAIAAGCPFVLKPADRTPLSAVMLGEEILRHGWPAAAVSVIPGDADVGRALTSDPGIDLITFTGSTAVGHAIAAQAGPIKALLELGSNAPTLVFADADLRSVVDRTVVGGFTANGQSCISVQRILVERSRYDEFVDALAEKVRALRCGDPADAATDVGPVIDDGAAARIGALIQDAEERGARIVVGGTREGRLIQPTLVAGLDVSMRLHREEVFGPVVAVAPFDTVDEAVALANDTPFGLQAGVFTDSLDVALSISERLEFGSVHINEISTFRPDHMPYGGVKASGLGKEGPVYMAREMSEFTVVSMKRPGAAHG